MDSNSSQVIKQLIVIAYLAVLHLGTSSTPDLCQEELSNRTIFLPDPNGNCSSFYICTRGRATQLSCRPGVWDNMTSACVPRHSQFDSCSDDRKNESSACLEGNAALTSHRTNCAQYYDCQLRDSFTGQWEPRLVECPYPMLFNNVTSRCEPYRFVACGLRYEPKQPCEYQANKCNSVGANICEPCSKRFPSCAELEDGLQPWPEKEWTAMFMTCKDERVLTRGKCPSPAGREGIFHPRLRFCVSILVDES